MFRFTMPKTPDIHRRVALLKDQCVAFMESPALAGVFDVLETDRATFLKDQKEGFIRVEDSKKRTDLYPFLDELGFFRINKPLLAEYDHILVLGGRLNACFERTKGASRWIGEKTLTIDGLTTDRRIEDKEREVSAYQGSFETEDEALREAFSSVFGKENNRCRLFVTPKRGTAGRRPDTGDTFVYYLERAGLKEGATLLGITNNRYCNRQFLQMAHLLLKNHINANLDVVGITRDENIVSPDSFDAAEFLKDLAGVLYWIGEICQDYQ